MIDLKKKKTRETAVDMGKERQEKEKRQEERGTRWEIKQRRQEKKDEGMSSLYRI